MPGDDPDELEARQENRIEAAHLPDLPVQPRRAAYGLANASARAFMSHRLRQKIAADDGREVRRRRLLAEGGAFRYCCGMGGSEDQAHRARRSSLRAALADGQISVFNWNLRTGRVTRTGGLHEVIEIGRAHV